MAVCIVHAECSDLSVCLMDSLGWLFVFEMTELDSLGVHTDVEAMVAWLSCFFVCSVRDGA